METREFWEDRERRFRSLHSPARRAQAMYVEVQESASDRLIDIGARLLAIVPHSIGGVVQPVDSSIPLEVVFERAKATASVGAFVQRLRDGEYVAKWHLTVEHPANGHELDRLGADVLTRFRAEAEIAARAADLVIARNVSADEAIDTWLDRIWNKPPLERDMLMVIPDFIASSATLCVEFAAQAYRPKVEDPTEARAAKRRQVLQPLLDAKGWSSTRWAERAGVDKSVPISFISGETLRLRKETRNALADALEMPRVQFPE